MVLLPDEKVPEGFQADVDRIIKMGKDPVETQAEKFKKLAREIEADEDEKAFKAKLKKLAKVRGGKPKGK